MATTRIEKDKQFYLLYTEEHPDKPVQYNPITNTIISFTGREVQKLPACIGSPSSNEYLSQSMLTLFNLIKTAANSVCGNNAEIISLRKIEPYFPYLDKVDFWNIPPAPPKGYIKFALDNDLRISLSSYNKFKGYMFFKSQPEWVQETAEKLKEISNGSYDFSYLVNHFCTCSDYEKPNIPLIHAYYKIIKRSFSCFYYDFRALNIRFERFIESIIDLRVDPVKYLNTDRDIEFNNSNLEAIYDSIKYKGLNENLKKLNPINGMTFGDLIVVVPQDVTALTNEGNQQHNCVGHFYHSSISAGENFIYFIRKKDAPDKSYITCRYNKQCHATAEYRAFANTMVKDIDALTFIKTLNAKIREIEL